MLSHSKTGSQQARQPSAEVTPMFEDAGLFKTALCDLMLELIPQTRRNERQDLIVRGFVERRTEIDVLFSGPRAAEVGPLESRLKALMAQARRHASETGGKVPDVKYVRLPVRAQGSWRRALKRDESGWETGTYHFVVAQWSWLNSEGRTVSFGEKPTVFLPL